MVFVHNTLSTAEKKKRKHTHTHTPHPPPPTHTQNKTKQNKTKQNKTKQNKNKQTKIKTLVVSNTREGQKVLATIIFLFTWVHLYKEQKSFSKWTFESPFFFAIELLLLIVKCKWYKCFIYFDVYHTEVTFTHEDSKWKQNE